VLQLAALTDARRLWNLPCARSHPDVFAVDIESRLEDVLLLMAERQLGSARVTRHGKLVGIFTATDACRCFGEYLRDLRPGEDEPA
jgi:CBS domain-containing protein